MLQFLATYVHTYIRTWMICISTTSKQRTSITHLSSWLILALLKASYFSRRPTSSWFSLVNHISAHIRMQRINRIGFKTQYRYAYRTIDRFHCIHTYVCWYIYILQSQDIKSFKNAYRDTKCMYEFIEMGDCCILSSCVCTVFLKKNYNCYVIQYCSLAASRTTYTEFSWLDRWS